MVCRSTVEEKILDVAKGKMVLEHLVVATMGGGSEGREGGGRRRDGAQEQSAMDEILMYGAKSLFEEDAAGAGLDTHAAWCCKQAVTLDWLRSRLRSPRTFSITARGRFAADWCLT